MPSGIGAKAMRTAAIAGVMAGGLLGSNVHAQTPALPTDLPAALKPTGLSPYLQVSAQGVQRYTCEVNAGAATWTFKEPQASLFDMQQRRVGRHGAGPTWTALDGGKPTGSVVGAVKASAPGGAGNIPWLLLDVTSREGSGIFSDAKGILRINTQGGVAPAQGCDEAHAGQKLSVPYTANYVFLK